jgi:type I restriction enzyme S subunit
MKYATYESKVATRIQWLNEIPRHWGVERLKTVATYCVSNVDKVPADNELPVRLCNYTDVYYNDLIEPDMGLMETTATVEEIRKFGLRVNDVVITKDSEDWRDIAVAAMVVKSAPDLVCGYHLAIVRPNAKQIYGPFLLRLFESSAVNQQFQIAASGVTRYGLPKSAIGEAWLPLPPVEEQQTIARFLDAKTAQMDELIAKKRLLIAKLKEKRQALIARTVTRGLPPEAAKAAGLEPNPEMKDSGVGWLGAVPARWEIKAIKWATPVQRGASPRPIDDPSYFDDDGEYAWVRISDVTAAGMYLDATEQRLSDLGSSLSVKIEPGGLFLSIAGTVGKPCIANIKCCIHDGFVYFPLWKGEPRFLFYLFASGEPYKGLGKMGTQLNLNTDTVGSIVISVPEAAEQKLITDYLDRTTAELDTMATTVEAAIDRLTEYRQALITAAVTGKIDVCEAA